MTVKSKHFIEICFALVLIACSNSVDASTNDTHIVLAGWNMDSNLLTHTSEYVATNYGEPVETIRFQAAEDGPSNLKEVLNIFKSETNRFVVLLASSSAGGDPLTFAKTIDKKRGIALVNVDFLKGTLGNSQAEQKTYRWRVEREAMNSLGILIGLSNCFDGHCVMCNVVGLKGLDKKGRNFCMPCHIKVKKLLNNHLSNAAQLPPKQKNIAPNPEQKMPVEAIVPAGNVVLFAEQGLPRNLGERITIHLEKNLVVKVRIAEDPAQTSFVNDAFLRKLDVNDALVVVLVANPHVALSECVKVYPHLNICVVNVSPLLDPEKPDGKISELMLRRVDAEVMRGVGLIFDVPECQNPRCVMCDYKTLKDLDAKGRNFCPLCNGKMESEISKEGFARLFPVFDKELLMQKQTKKPASMVVPVSVMPKAKILHRPTLGKRLPPLGGKPKMPRPQKSLPKKVVLPAGNELDL